MEPKKGKFDFRSSDLFVEKTHETGIEVMGLLAYGNLWATTKPKATAVHPPDNPEDFGNFVHEVVKRYKSKISVWEIWNEQNAGFRFWKTNPKGDPDAYGALLKIAYRRAKEADPSSAILYGGLFYHGQAVLSAPDFLDASFKAHPDLSQYFDGLAFHPYTLYPPQVSPEFENGKEQSLFTMVQRLREVLKKYGSAAPLWITEVGWPLFGKVDEETQARYLVRSFLILMGEGVESICWYTFQDGSNPENFPPEHAFGMVRYLKPSLPFAEPEKKKSFQAFETLSKELGSLTYIGKETKNEVLAYQFANSSEEKWVFWTSNGTREISLKIKNKTWFCRDMLGQPLPGKDERGNVTLTISEDPVYCHGLNRAD